MLSTVCGDRGKGQKLGVKGEGELRDRHAGTSVSATPRLLLFVIAKEILNNLSNVKNSYGCLKADCLAKQM